MSVQFLRAHVYSMIEAISVNVPFILFFAKFALSCLQFIEHSQECSELKRRKSNSNDFQMKFIYSTKLEMEKVYGKMLVPIIVDSLKCCVIQYTKFPHLLAFVGYTSA